MDCFGLEALNKKDSSGWGLCKGQRKILGEENKKGDCTVRMADSEGLKYWVGKNVQIQMNFLANPIGRGMLRKDMKKYLIGHRWSELKKARQECHY